MKRNNLKGDVARGLITKKEALRRRTLYDRVVARADKILGPATKQSSPVSAPKKPGVFSREAAKKRSRAVGNKIPGISGILNMEEIAKRGREKQAKK
jgi:hypothetical protein